MASNHFREGRPWMVNVAEKDVTTRTAEAEARVVLPDAALRALHDDPKKGDPLHIAELAGIMASKRTADLIPLCHPLPLDSCEVRAEVDGPVIRIVARCVTTAKTGVEMEAMTAASIAALTVYDMLKGASKGIVVEQVRLLSKTGGTSGPWSA